MHSLFIGLGLSESLNVVLFYVCSMQNACNLKPSYHIIRSVSEGIFNTLEELSLF
jgi:hypothetical protein